MIVVEFLNNILPTVDRELSTMMQRIMTKRGVRSLIGSKVEDISDDKKPLVSVMKSDGTTEKFRLI